ncbi:MAG: right-handed parallel beta-helix repeat-containing protein [Hyphomicrobiaceae bacterium]
MAVSTNGSGRWRERRKARAVSSVGALFVALVLAVLAAEAATPVVIEVAAGEPINPDGRVSDKRMSAPRRVAAHAATLAEAVAIARRLREKGGSGLPIAIELAPGRHRLKTPVRLGPADGGTWTAPLVIRPAPGSGVVEINGALPLEPRGSLAGHARARDVAAGARAAVRRYRLPQALAAAPSIERPRFHAIAAVPLAFEIFDAGGALHPARWPNAGWARTAAAHAGARTLGFTADTTPGIGRLGAWAHEADLWLVGYPRYDWSYESLAVGRVDVTSGHLLLATPPRYGLADGRRVAVVHALSELDRPGEWYRDTASGEILLLPREGRGNAQIEASLAESAFVIEGASHIQIEGLTLTRFRGDAVVVNGGAGVVLDRVEISWAAGRAVVMKGARASGVSGADIHDCGEGGVALEGGDRATLSPSRQIVAESRFTRFSRLGRSYKPAVAVAGVGARVIGNVISDAPHMAVLISGNDHEIAENTIARVVQDADDAGAIYIGRDWTARGTVIRANVLCDIRAAPGFEVKGIYLDDFASGITVDGNLFLRVDQPVFVGGGRDNTVARNVFVASSPGVHLDARGLTWARSSVEDPASELRRALAAMPVTSPLWRRRYPTLADLLRDEPMLPKGNSLAGNLVVGGVALRRQGLPEPLLVASGLVPVHPVPQAARDARYSGDVASALAEPLAAAGLTEVAASWPRATDLCVGK